MKRIVCVTVSLVGGIAILFAMTFGISGKWTGIAKLPENDIMLNYTFISENGKLTGVAHGPANNYDILDGVVNGDSLSFNVVVEDGNKVLNKGKYYSDGDSICLNFIISGTNTVHITLKRDTINK